MDASLVCAYIFQNIHGCLRQSSRQQHPKFLRIKCPSLVDFSKWKLRMLKFRSENVIPSVVIPFGNEFSINLRV